VGPAYARWHGNRRAAVCTTDGRELCTLDIHAFDGVFRCGLGGAVMENFAVAFQGLISVATRVEPAAGEVARDRPPRDAMTPYVPKKNRRNRPVFVSRKQRGLIGSGRRPQAIFGSLHDQQHDAARQ
jgi:hypothetical protein